MAAALDAPSKAQIRDFRSWVVVLVIGTVWAKWVYIQPFIPGQWVRDLFGPILPYGLFLVGALGTFQSLLLMKRWNSCGITVLILFLVLAFPGPSKKGRIAAELPLMKKSVEGGQPYGPVRQKQVNGRQIWFWAWNSVAIDNETGVAYDPEDKLESELKNGRAADIIAAEKVETSWYFIETT